MVFSLQRGENGEVIGKHVFCGDEKASLDAAKKLGYEIVDESTFNSAQKAKTSDQKAWDLLKPTATAVEKFLAKRLGFE